MTAFIVDASAIGPLIVPDERADINPAMLELLESDGAVAPQHWRLEVANLMRMAVRRKRLDARDLPELVTMLRDLDIEIDDETGREAWGRTLALSSQYDLSVYDAAYLELAQRRRLPIATLDTALIRAALSAKVELIDE